MSVAWMPHVSHHDKEVVYGKQKVFVYFWPFKSREIAYEKVKKIKSIKWGRADLKYQILNIFWFMKDIYCLHHFFNI